MRGEYRMSQAAIAVLLAVAGCASWPAAPSMTDHATRLRQAESALQEARAEAAALRADVATARIAAAKQEAELRELRRRILELQTIVEAKQVELVSLQNERDRLAQSATVAQVHVAEPTVQGDSADELKTLKDRLHDMETTLAGLVAELAQVRKDTARPAGAATER